MHPHFRVQGALEVGGGHHVRNRREVIPAAGEEGAGTGADEAEAAPLMKLGLGGGALGSEGYGEATMGSVHRIGVALSHLRALVLRELFPTGWGLLWDLGPWSSFLDVGSGYGKVVLHLRLVAGMHASVGVECVSSRHHIAMRAKQLCESEAHAIALHKAGGGEGNLPKPSRSKAKAKAEGAAGPTSATLLAREGSVSDSISLNAEASGRDSPSSEPTDGAPGTMSDETAPASARGASSAPAASAVASTSAALSASSAAASSATAEAAEATDTGSAPDSAAPDSAGAGAPGSAAAASSAVQANGAATLAGASASGVLPIVAASGLDRAVPVAETSAGAGSVGDLSAVVPRVVESAFDGVELRHSDVTVEPKLCYTHIYIFDWVFSKPTLRKLAKVGFMYLYLLEPKLCYTHIYTFDWVFSKPTLRKLAKVGFMYLFMLEPKLCYTHIYIFDWVFSKPTLRKLAKVDPYIRIYVCMYT